MNKQLLIIIVMMALVICIGIIVVMNFEIRHLGRYWVCVVLAAIFLAGVVAAGVEVMADRKKMEKQREEFFRKEV